MNRPDTATVPRPLDAIAATLPLVHRSLSAVCLDDSRSYRALRADHPGLVGLPDAIILDLSPTGMRGSFSMYLTPSQLVLLANTMLTDEERAFVNVPVAAPDDSCGHDCDDCNNTRTGAHGCQCCRDVEPEEPGLVPYTSEEFREIQRGRMTGPTYSMLAAEPDAEECP